jgi:hypothetical protein
VPLLAFAETLHALLLCLQHEFFVIDETHFHLMNFHSRWKEKWEEKKEENYY